MRGGKEIGTIYAGTTQKETARDPRKCTLALIFDPNFGTPISVAAPTTGWPDWWD